MKELFRIHEGIPYRILIGSNKKENLGLLDLVRPTDRWYHLSSMPSAYVVCCPGVEEGKDPLSASGGNLLDVPIEVSDRCAQACRSSGKYRSLRNLKVDTCLVSNLVKGACVGEVFYKSNRQVTKITLT